MKDGAIFQFYEGPLHKQMIEAARYRHVRYAELHDFDYFVYNEPESIDFCNAVMAEMPEAGLPEETGVGWWLRAHCQQTTATNLLAKPPYSEIVRKLPPTWNDALWHPIHMIPGSNPGEPRIVRAWHGIPSETTKLEEIRKFVGDREIG